MSMIQTKLGLGVVVFFFIIFFFFCHVDLQYFINI